MSDYAYTRLSELDHSFLIYEGPNSPMHVGVVQIHEAGPLRGASGAIDLERLLEYVASRLHLIPRYRQRVEPAPLDGHPDLGGRCALQPPLSPAPQPPAAARKRAGPEAHLRAHPRAAAGSAQAAVGDVAGGGPRERSRRHRQQDPPLHDRRRLGRRSHERADVAGADGEDRPAGGLAAAPEPHGPRVRGQRGGAARGLAGARGARPLAASSPTPITRGATSSSVCAPPATW